MTNRSCLCTRPLGNNGLFCDDCISRLPENLRNNLQSFQYRAQARLDGEQFLLNQKFELVIERPVRLGGGEILRRGERYQCSLKDALALFVYSKRARLVESAPPPPAAA